MDNLPKDLHIINMLPVFKRISVWVILVKPIPAESIKLWVIKLTSSPSYTTQVWNDYYIDEKG